MTSKKFFAVGAASALLLTALAGSADAQGRGRGQDKDKGKAQSQGTGQDKNKDKTKKDAAANTQVVVVFRDTDRVTLREYFVTQRITAQPLPPGIAMNIARGKPLPPGIAKKVVPANVIITGTRVVDPTVTYYFVGDRVVAVRNGNVIDVLLNIFR